MREAPLPEVARLRLQSLGGQPRRLAARLRGQARPENFCPLLSRVLLLDDDVAGVCLLSRLQPELALVDSVAVIPSLRGRWANVLLKYATFDHVLAQGVTRIRFRAAARHTDTHRHAARAQAQVVARIVLPYHPL